MLNLKKRIDTKTSSEISLHPRKHIIRQKDISLNLLMKAFRGPWILQSQSVSPIIQRLVPVSEGLGHQTRHVEIRQTEHAAGGLRGGIRQNGWSLARIHCGLDIVGCYVWFGGRRSRLGRLCAEGEDRKG